MQTPEDRAARTRRALAVLSIVMISLFASADMTYANIVTFEPPVPPGPWFGPANALMFTEDKIDVRIQNYMDGCAVPRLDLAGIVDAFPDFGLSKILRNQNCNAEFDFTATPMGATNVVFEYYEWSDSNNLKVNGETCISPLDFSLLDNTIVAPLSGVTAKVVSTNLGGGFERGKVILEGPVSTLEVGGVEIYLDNVEQVESVDVTVSTTATAPVSLLTVPDGSGRPLSNAMQWDGTDGSTPANVNATITVRLEQGGVPVVGFPANQIQLASSAGGWILSPPTNRADGPTGPAGETTFSRALHGGGYSGPGELMQVNVIGVPIGTVTYLGPNPAGLDIRVNSPDIDMSTVVNLVDLGAFAADYGLLPPFPFRSDYQWNNVGNLVDLGYFSSANGASFKMAPPSAAIPAASDDVLGIYFDRAGRSRSASVQVGQDITAYLALSGPAARRGIDAWDAALITSDNVELEGVVLPERSINVGRGSDYVVGTGGLVKAEGGQPLLLATLHLSVTDDTPASITLRSPSSSAEGMPAISDGKNLVGVSLASGSAALPVAFLNEENPTEIAAATSHLVNLRNEPNPFNPSTSIKFDLPRTGRVEIRVYEVNGRLVRRLEGGILPAGENRIAWNGTDHNGAPVKSGLYFCQLFLDGRALGLPQKMSLLK